MDVLLDTHVWVWWLSQDVRLKAKEQEKLDQLAAEQRLCLAAISLWEVQTAYAKGRFQPDEEFGVWLRTAAGPDVIRIAPIDVSVVLALNELPRTLSKDPADRLIVATARAHSLALATYDSNIRRSRVVKLWKP